MPFVLPPAITAAVTLLVTGFAFLRGGPAERLLAAIAVAIYLLPQGDYGRNIAMEAAINAAAFAALLALALRSDKPWTLVAAAIGLVSLWTDLVQMARPVTSWAYGTACLTWEYLYLATLAAGTGLAWRQGRAARLSR